MPGSFFNLELEASGSLLVDEPADRTAFVFDFWLGNDMVRAYPAVLVTTRVKRGLLELEKPTGFAISRARVTTSEFFRQHSARKRLPVFWSIQIHGRPGQDDLGLTAAGILVVSRRVLDVLQEFNISRAVMTQYVPSAN